MIFEADVFAGIGRKYHLPTEHVQHWPRREIDLKWTRGGGDETGISIFRRTGTGDWQRIGVVAPSRPYFADRSVQPGKSYGYEVRAHNSHSVSAWTNGVSGLTLPAP